MILETASEALEVAKKEENKEILAKAKYHESRLRLHGVSETNNQDHGKYSLITEDAFRVLLYNVEKVLPPDKFETVKHMMRPPFKTNKIVKKVFSEISKIFDGQNRNISYTFENEKYQEVFTDYMNNEFKDQNFWQQDGIDAFKYAIHSIIIVDLPREQEGKYPAPYYYLLPIERVRSIKVDEKTGKIEYIVFKASENSGETSVYCDKYYRVFDKDEVLITESAHDLGFAPARFFVEQLLNPSKDKIQREGLLTDALTDLDDYLKWSVFKEYADLYGAFPILVSLDVPCGVPGCINGTVVKKKKEQFINEKGEEDERFVNEEYPCASCNGVDNFGPGSHFKAPVRRSSDDPQQSTPIELVTPDTKNLEYIDGKLDKIDKAIYLAAIGSYQTNPDSKQFNEDQVQSLYDQKINTLMAVKRIFEDAHRWSNEVVAELMFGKDQLRGITVFYGDEFYLKTVGDISNEYKQAEENGEPSEELHSIYIQKIKTKYKGNPVQLKRSLLLAKLNPLPHLKIEDAIKLYENGVISQVDFVIRVNFNKFIDRFERENKVNIVEFGKEANDPTVAQENIINDLERYAQEQISKNQPVEQIPPAQTIVNE